MKINKNEGRGKFIFVIDDHIPVVEGFINLIKRDLSHINFQFEKALNCKQSYEKIIALQKDGIMPDVAIIDMSLPECIEQELYSGLEVGQLIRKHFPDTKIIIATGFTEVAPTKIMMEKLQPEAVLCKSDITYGVFDSVFKQLDAGETYISAEVQKVLQDDLVKQLELDLHDLEILDHLNKGIHTKDLPKYINLSLSAIEKRKAYMKFHLAGTKASDKEFLTKAKMLNFIKK